MRVSCPATGMYLFACVVDVKTKKNVNIFTSARPYSLESVEWKLFPVFLVHLTDSAYELTHYILVIVRFRLSKLQPTTHGVSAFSICSGVRQTVSL